MIKVLAKMSFSITLYIHPYLHTCKPTLLQLLQRLLTDRRRSMDIIMLDGPQPVDATEEEGEQTKLKLSTLKQKWEALQLDAEQRSVAFLGT